MKKWYTSAIEHYLRTAVRYPEPMRDGIARCWQTRLQEWMERLDEHSRDFIKAVFSYDFLTVDKALAALPGEPESKWRRLKRLERDAAHTLGLFNMHAETEYKEPMLTAGERGKLKQAPGLIDKK